jgi:hypothetical protein
MSSSNPRTARNRPDVRPARPRRMNKSDKYGEIVRLVYDYRILTQKQIERLREKAPATVQRQLMQLYHHHYLERLFMPIAHFGSSPAFYILGKRGIEYLKENGVMDFTGVPNKDLSDLFLHHTVALNNFRIAVTKACEKIGWTMLKWQTENEIKSDYDRVEIKDKRRHSRSIPIVPDSYFVIDIPNRGVSHFFIEVDRGKMQHDRFKTKVIGYVTYYKNGAYEQRYQAKGFRVLTIVDTATSLRVKNLVSETETVEGIGRRFWFVHLPTISVENVLVEPIWTVAGQQTLESLFKTGN